MLTAIKTVAGMKSTYIPIYIHLPTLLQAVHFTYPSSAPTSPQNIHKLICKNLNKTTNTKLLIAIIETKKEKVRRFAYTFVPKSHLT